MVLPADAAGAPGFVDARKVRRNFAQVAAGYAEADFLTREIDRRMLERLDYVRIEPQRVLDLGSGAGGSQHALRERYRKAEVLALDACPEMLHAARGERSRLLRLLPFLGGRSQALVCADAAALPLAGGRMDLIWSNQMLPWCDDPAAVLGEAHRVLAVGGLLMFSTLGPDTLRELRAAFADSDIHTQRFLDMHDLGDMLVGAGFADPVMDMELVTLTYPDFPALLADLRGSGARCAMRGRRAGLMGRAAWQQAGTRLEAGRDAAGRFPLTVEVVYGHAWKPQPRTTNEGHAIVHFERRRGTS